MDTMVKVFGGGVMAVGAVFLFVIFGTLFGALAGWIVGLFFGDTILGILSQMGIRNVSMWQFGAFMGFVGGFLKTKTIVEAKS